MQISLNIYKVIKQIQNPKTKQYLKTQFNKLQEDSKKKELNNKLIIDKYKTQIEQANNKILELNGILSKLQPKNIFNNKENNDLIDKDEDFLEEEDDDDLDLIPYNEALINKDKEKSCLKKIRIPKLMVSLQKNVLNEEKLTERAKIKSEQ